MNVDCKFTRACWKVMTPFFKETNSDSGVDESKLFQLDFTAHMCLTSWFYHQMSLNHSRENGPV